MEHCACARPGGGIASLRWATPEVCKGGTARMRGAQAWRGGAAHRHAVHQGHLVGGDLDVGVACRLQGRSRKVGGPPGPNTQTCSAAHSGRAPGTAGTQPVCGRQQRLPAPPRRLGAGHRGRAQSPWGPPSARPLCPAPLPGRRGRPGGGGEGGEGWSGPRLARGCAAAPRRAAAPRGHLPQRRRGGMPGSRGAAGRCRPLQTAALASTPLTPGCHAPAARPAWLAVAAWCQGRHQGPHPALGGGAVRASRQAVAAREPGLACPGHAWRPSACQQCCSRGNAGMRGVRQRAGRCPARTWMQAATRSAKDMDWPATTGSRCVSRVLAMPRRATSPRLAAYLRQGSRGEGCVAGQRRVDARGGRGGRRAGPAVGVGDTRHEGRGRSG